MGKVFLSFNINRPRRMTELNNQRQAASRSPAENTRF
jgi:hypothetical protein